MEIFADGRRIKDLIGKYIFLDNDFLSEIFSDEDLFQNCLDFFQDSFLIIDSLVKFEFLRDTYIPEQRELKERFIGREEIFNSVSDHNQIFTKLQNNALLLSKIYMHQKQPQCKPSFIDLMLAARVMYYANRAVLVTGNRKDYPSCVFDIITVLNTDRQKDGKVLSYPVMLFSPKISAFEVKREG